MNTKSLADAIFRKILSKGSSLIALSLISISLLHESSHAEVQIKQSNNPNPIKDRVNFYCGNILDDETGEEIPATVAYVPQRKTNVPIIGWKTYIPDWDAQRRCETVSPKFQTFYEDGRLNYLTTGKKNGYDIICAAMQPEQSCADQDQLFQVNNSNDPEAVLKAMVGIIEGNASPTILFQSSGEKIYVSVEELLNAASPIEDANLNSN